MSITREDFERSLDGEAPPKNISPLLTALWHDKKGNWEQAHEIAQEVENSDGAWVHAYLHRKEGDLGNAAYWYRQAGRKTCRATLEEEWEEIVAEMLSGSY